LTYKSYSKGMRLILIVLALLFLLRLLGLILIEEDQGVPLIFVVNHFALRIVLLCLLFFSIYALFSRIKPTRKLESPIILTIIGIVFVLLSYGPPIVLYSMTYNENSHFSDLDAEQAKKEAVNINLFPGARLQAVRNYYLDTGERLTYLDKNNSEVLYAPDDMALKLHEVTAKLKLMRATGKIIALSLILILVASVICFTVFLWYRFSYKAHNEMKSEDGK
jgi:hypothetical protein